MVDRFAIVATTISAEFAKPYVYGASDCFFLGLRMADALDPSLDLVVRYSDTYSTLLGANKALRKRGFSSLADLFGSHLETCGAAEARTGDIVILQLGKMQHVGICLANRFVTKTDAGRSDHLIGDVVAAFRAG